MNPLREKLKAGQVALGLNNMYPASGIVEGMCKGWDFVWVDGQHGQHSYESVLHAVQAAQGRGIAALVRVPGHEHGFLGPYADLGPDAVMVPMVDTPEQARRIVAGLRFPPEGERSYGGRRVIDLDGRDYFREARLLVVAQIETQRAVEAAGEIAAVPGVDALFFGPDDMKVRLGIEIDTPPARHAELRRAMERTAQAAQAAGKHAGCVVGDAVGLRMAVEMGYRLIAAGSDILFIRTGAAARLKDLKAALNDAAPEAGAPKASAVY